MKRVVLGYYATSEEAEMALAKYKMNPYNVDDKDTSLLPEILNRKSYTRKTYIFDSELIKRIRLFNFEHNRHSTRHTFITAMQKLGVSETKIKGIVGHKSQDIMDGVYTHFEPEDLFIEIKKLDYGD